MRTCFLSCDWGTTAFRLRLVEVVDQAPTLIDEVRSQDGCRAMSSGGPDAYVKCLKQHARQLTRKHHLPAELPIVISGMASSSIGWRELPYAQLPFRVDGEDLRTAELQAEGRVLLISGLASGDDVMRGEETELIGLYQHPQLAAQPAAMVIMPGTHSKHIEVRDGKVIGFRTHMTGELFEILARHSILAASLSDDAAAQDAEAFLAGVDQAGDTALTHTLFTVRTNQLFQRFDKVRNRAFLSGLLIGHELHDLLARAPAASIVIGSSGSLAASYRAALLHLGAGPRLIEAGEDFLATAVMRAHACIWRRHATLSPEADR